MTPSQARLSAQGLRDEAVTLQNQATANLTSAALLDQWADVMDAAHSCGFTPIMPQDVIDFYATLPAPAPSPPAQGSPTVTIPPQVT